MPPLANIAEPNKCWFCNHDNPSWAATCEECYGPTLPTCDENKHEVKIGWTVFSFGPRVLTEDDRTSFSKLDYALNYLSIQDRVAVRLGDHKIQYLIISQDGQIFYHVNEKNEENEERWRGRWDKDEKEVRDSLSRFVAENEKR